MDPLITNGIDPALLRVLDKRGQERDQAQRRRRPAAVPDSLPEEANENQEPDTNAPPHELDDLA